MLHKYAYVFCSLYIRMYLAYLPTWWKVRDRERCGGEVKCTMNDFSVIVGVASLRSNFRVFRANTVIPFQCSIVLYRSFKCRPDLDWFVELYVYEYRGPYFFQFSAERVVFLPSKWAKYSLKLQNSNSSMYKYVWNISFFWKIWANLKSYKFPVERDYISITIFLNF